MLLKCQGYPTSSWPWRGHWARWRKEPLTPGLSSWAQPPLSLSHSRKGKSHLIVADPHLWHPWEGFIANLRFGTQFDLLARRVHYSRRFAGIFLLAVSLLWLEFSCIVAATWQHQVLVWLGIFQVFGTSNLWEHESAGICRTCPQILQAALQASFLSCGL